VTVQFMDYDRRAMSRMIDRLESKNLIRRVPLRTLAEPWHWKSLGAGKAAFPKMEHAWIGCWPAFEGR